MRQMVVISMIRMSEVLSQEKHGMEAASLNEYFSINNYVPLVLHCIKKG